MGAKPSRSKKEKEGFNGDKPSFGTLVGSSSSSCLSLSCMCFCAFLVVAIIFGIAQTQFIGEAGKAVTAIGSTPEGAAALGALSGKPAALGALSGKPGASSGIASSLEEIAEVAV